LKSLFSLLPYLIESFASFFYDFIHIIEKLWVIFTIFLDILFNIDKILSCLFFNHWRYLFRIILNHFFIIFIAFLLCIFVSYWYLWFSLFLWELIYFDIIVGIITRNYLILIEIFFKFYFYCLFYQSTDLFLSHLISLKCTLCFHVVGLIKQVIFNPPFISSPFWNSL
jgi:hypothetical protein